MEANIQQRMEELKREVVIRDQYKDLTSFDRCCQMAHQMILMGAKPREIVDILLP